MKKIFSIFILCSFFVVVDAVIAKSTGSLNLLVSDSEMYTCGRSISTASIAGSIYKLYKEDGTFVTDLTIGDDCSAKIDGLDFGKYYLKEEKSGYGYKLDTKVYYFEITSEEYEIELNLYNAIKEVNFTLNVSYLVDDTLEKEENSEFIIYSKENNETILDFFTDETGVVQILFPYGNYILHQESTVKGYKKVSDIDITIDEYTKLPLIVDVINEPLTAKLKLAIVDEDNSKILQSGFKFQIYDLNNNELVCYDEDCIYETNENGEFITQDLPLSNYRIIKVSENSNDYLDVILDYDSNYEQDLEGNLLFNLNFINYKVPVIDEEDNKDLNLNDELLDNTNDNTLNEEVTDNYFDTSNLEGTIDLVDEVLNNEDNLDEIILDDKIAILLENQELNSNDIVVELPNTYKNKSYITFIIGLLCMAIGIGGYKYKSIKK